MISYIKGELTEVFEDTVVVETNGIGYNIRVPGSVLDRLPSVGSSVWIYTYLYVKEDAMNLSRRFLPHRVLAQRRQSG